MSMIFSKRKLRNRKRGFLLPDVLLAMFVISTALVAAIAAIVPSLQLETRKRDEIIAIGLAQEGIEVVRNMRDNNWKNDKSAFAAPFPSNGHICGDYTGMAHCGGSTALYNNNGIYGAVGSGTTKFTRTITINNANGNKERAVSSTVSWNGHSVNLSATLTAWGDK